MGVQGAIEAEASTDDIRIFLGEIPDDLYTLRSRIRTARNCSTFRLNTAESADARCLLRLCADAASAWIYADATPAELREQSEYCRRLLALAEHAEKIWQGLCE